MDIFIISITALSASLLTFFSGFGLGTILMPVFAIFFPIEVAIALTGIVHLLNNIFKMFIVGKQATWSVVKKFGIPAIIGAFIGAYLLVYLSNDKALFEYNIGTKLCIISPVKIIVSILMFSFAILEILPFYKKLEFSENKLFLGGAISGFFGGISGHQGALRSAFLIKYGLSKESFIATGVIIASIVDISRISVYFTKFSEIGIKENATILLIAVASAFIGAFLGKKLLKKITIEFVHNAVTIMIIILAILLGIGII